MALALGDPAAAATAAPGRGSSGLRATPPAAGGGLAPAAPGGEPGGAAGNDSEAGAGPAPLAQRQALAQEAETVARIEAVRDRIEQLGTLDAAADGERLEQAEDLVNIFVAPLKDRRAQSAWFDETAAARRR